MRHSDTNNIQSSHHRQADVRNFTKASDRQRIDALIRRANVVATMTLIYHCLINCATMLMNNYLTIYEETLTIPYIISSPGIASLTEL